MIDELAGLPLARVPVQARSRQKVLRALEAAEAVSAEHGLGAVNLNRIAADAGVSVGTLYQYLPSGDAIAAALVVRHHQRLEAAMDEFVDRMEADAQDPGVSAGVEADPGAAAETVLDAIIAVSDQERDLRTLREVTGQVVADIRAAHKRRMREKVARMLLAGGVDPERAPTAATIIFGACDAVLHDETHSETELRRFQRTYLTDLVKSGPA